MEQGEIFTAIELQLNEVEILKSIYPNEKEVVIEDLYQLAQMKKFHESGGKSTPPMSSFSLTIHLQLNKKPRCISVEASLPVNYPLASLPSLRIRSGELNRTEQLKLNEKLAAYMEEEVEVGETCLFQVAQWASENAASCVELSEMSPSKLSGSKSAQNRLIHKQHTFTRLWIYSHHIYNKEKRKSILDWAKELKLTGFSMPGKPGVICVEGSREQCDEYWQRLRHQTWKRLSVVDRVDEVLRADESLDGRRKFRSAVAECDFGVHGGRDYHMDLGKFRTFLCDHDCADAFAVLFGVQGKTTA